MFFIYIFPLFSPLAFYQAIIILDVPSVDHIASLASSFGPSGLYYKFWSNDLGSASVSGEEEHIVRVVHHLVGDGVLEDERYKTFMNGFGSQTHVSYIFTSYEAIETY
jgi:ribonuclease Z